MDKYFYLLLNIFLHLCIDNDYINNMEELNINYGISQKHRITNIVIFSYFAGFGLYLSIREAITVGYNVLFFLALLCFILGAILILRNTVWLPSPILTMDGNRVAANTVYNKKFAVNWVDVSRVNIGPGYVVFLVNGGQKQSKLELLSLKYEDLLAVKSKIIEICEYKNIPYSND